MQHYLYVYASYVSMYLSQDALVGSLLRLIQRMTQSKSAKIAADDRKEDKGLTKALCPALAIPDDPSVRVCRITDAKSPSLCHQLPLV